MSLQHISNSSLREALQAVRDLSLLAEHPLLELTIVRRRVGRQDATIADPTLLAQALCTLLSETIEGNLHEHRAAAVGEQAGHERSVQEEIESDFSASNIRLETWSSLYYRFIATQPLSTATIGKLAKPGFVDGDRHIRRRLALGYDLLADILRHLEREAHRLEEERVPHPIGPQPAPAVTTRFQIPAPMSRLIGRAEEVERVAAALSQARLVTLVGPAGVGKTRLAMEVAHAVEGEYCQGILWFELTGIEDFEQFVGLLADALELAADERLSGMDDVRRALNDGHRLVVLDNCEHVVPACAALLENLLRLCPGVSMLITSRVPLRASGEQLIPLLPLAVPSSDEPISGDDWDRYPAIQLFKERCQAVDPDFEVATDTVPDVVFICRQLDGLPLAIELAAARIWNFSIAEIRQQLDERMAWQRAVLRNTTTRHWTLRDALDWSYGLLSGPAQQLLGRLSVLKDEWTLAAASAECGFEPLEPEDVPDLLASLVDQSLVTRTVVDGYSRFRLLETVRLFAAEKLAMSGEARPGHHGKLPDGAAI